MSTNTSAEPKLDEIPIPDDLAEAFRRVVDREEPPATLDEGFTIAEDALDAQGVDLELADMYRTVTTRHAVHLEDGVEYVPCVLDALIVALVVDEESVEVRSEPPDGGDPVVFRVQDGSVSVTPPEAVVSFGVAYDEAEGGFDTAEVLTSDDAAIPDTCSVINAFHDSDGYAEWAADVTDAAVMQLESHEVVVVARRAAEQYVD